MLEHVPLSGRDVPEYDDETVRELFVYSYRIIYAVEEDQTAVVAVIRGRRML
jgi:toxin ParE1/3/4